MSRTRRDDALAGTRRLFARLRQALAQEGARLETITTIIAEEMISEVCSIYIARPGDLLELAATHGLRESAVGHTRLRVGEGIVGLVAATGSTLNLPDAQTHPAFAYRPETGEERFASLLALPVRRSGHLLGVLTVQNRAPRHYTDIEVESLETVAMLLGETLARTPESVTAQGAESPHYFSAMVLCSGIVIGQVVRRGRHHSRKVLLADDPDIELKRLHSASEAVQRGLDEMMTTFSLVANDETDRDGAGASRDIMEAYRLIAADSGWFKRVTDAIRTGLSAEAGVMRVLDELRETSRRITDPYLRERLADLEDVAAHLLARLEESDMVPAALPPGSVLVARRIGPAELLQWYERGVAGLVIEEATPTGHAAILARALGLPALAAARGATEAATEGDAVILDAFEGRLVLRPEPEVGQGYAKLLETVSERSAMWSGLRDRPTTTSDGVRIDLMLNVGLVLELDQLEAVGADGIGLFRTEVEMLARGVQADRALQKEIYSRVLDAAAGRPVWFRTLDLGGDKLLPGDPLPQSDNPAMGWRSLRIGLDRPALLRRQLRALIEAARGGPLSVMFPMVATVAEFNAARALLLIEAERAASAPSKLAVGSMVEVPSLLWQLPHLMEVADFVSVGSNDLLQFFFAADRGTPALANRYDFLSAPVLDFLEAIVREAARTKTALSFCGEAAAHPLEALVLAALGFRSISVPPTAVLPVKAMLTAADLTAIRPVLSAIRRSGASVASLRDPLRAWAQEHGLPV